MNDHSFMTVEAAEAVTVGGIPVVPFKNIQEVITSVIPDDGQVRQGFAIAINPEKIIRAQHDSEVRNILLAATMRYADGIGVVKTLRRKGMCAQRIPGVDFWQALMKRAGEFGSPVYLLGARQDVVENVAAKIRRELNVTVVGAVPGFFTDEEAVVRELAAARPRIVAVAMGSPRQEKFILRCRREWPDAFYMGVGGTFDVHSGVVKRAPKLFQKVGMEWLYRLLAQPARAHRYKALIEYLYLHLRNRL